MLQYASRFVLSLCNPSVCYGFANQARQRRHVLGSICPLPLAVEELGNYTAEPSGDLAQSTKSGGSHGSHSVTATPIAPRNSRDMSYL